MDGNKPTSREHDSGNRETVRVSQIRQIWENDDDDNRDNHQCPVNNWDVDLALDSLGGVAHTQWRECFSIDNLLNETKGGSDQRLGCNQLLRD